MFPHNQYKDDVTIFTPWTDPQTKMIRYVRHLLRKCFWRTESIAVRRHGGTAAPSQITLHIPLKFNPGYEDAAAWTQQAEQPQQWTICLGGDMEKTLIVKGDASYDALSVPQFPEEMEETIAKLTRDHGAPWKEAKDVNEILFGPSSMHRIVVDC